MTILSPPVKLNNICQKPIGPEYTFQVYSPSGITRASASGIVAPTTAQDNNITVPNNAILFAALMSHSKTVGCIKSS